MGKQTVVQLRRDIKKAHEVAEYHKAQWHDTQSRLQKAERQRDELERINRDYERDLEHDTEMLQESQARAVDTSDSLNRALRIIDRLAKG